jgi:hypothetical protein
MAQYVMEADSFFMIADVALNRMTRLRKPDLEVEGTVPIPGRLISRTPVLFPDGSYVMWGLGFPSGAAGHGLHHVSADGRILVSFGPSARARGGESPPAMAAAGGKAIWVAYDDYRIEKWSLAGQLLASYVREASWVRPSTRSSEVGEWISWVSRVWEDEQGHLWICHLLRRKVDMGVDRDPQAGETIIEILDLDSLSVVAQSREKGVKDVGVEGPGFHLGRLKSSPLGLRMMDISGFHFRHPSPIH